MTPPTANDSIAPPNELVAQFLNWEQLSRDTIDFKKAYVDMAGDLIAGLTLSQIIYWHLPGRNGVTRLQVSHDGQMWIAKKREEWWEEIRISAKQLDRALKILEDKKLIVTAIYHFNNTPIKHVRLNWDGFIPKFQNLIAPKGPEKTDPILPKGKNRKGSILPKGQNANSPKGKVLYNIDYDQRLQNTLADSPCGDPLAGQALEPARKLPEPTKPEPQPITSLIPSLEETAKTQSDQGKEPIKPDDWFVAVSGIAHGPYLSYEAAKRASVELRGTVTQGQVISGMTVKSVPKPPPVPRKPDPVFDAIALGSYGMARAPKGKGGHVGALAAGVKDCTADEHKATLAADLAAMYAWYKMAHADLAAPAKVETICKYLAEWRTAVKPPSTATPAMEKHYFADGTYELRPGR